MAKRYLIGIDVGTYSAKGVITDLDGSILASHTVQYQLSIPKPGWAEHDADRIWWDSFVKIAQQLIWESRVNAADIAAVACSAIGPVMLPVNRQGQPLRPAILYGIDTRATQEIKELTTSLGSEAIIQTCGNPLSAQSISPKILWYRKHEPALFEQTHRILNSNSYLVYKLTGEYTADMYNAGTFSGLFDIHRKEWDERMCAPVCDEELLPPVLWPTEVAGYTTKEAADITGLPVGIPVTAGVVDAAAEAISVGVTEPGETILAYGTTLSLIQVLARQQLSPTMWSGVYCLRDTFALSGGMATSAALTLWFRDNFGHAELERERQLGVNAYQQLAEACQHIPPGCEGLVVLPYFSGERTPLNDPKARGLVAGLTLSHTRNHMYRALLEGVGYGLRHNFEEMGKVGVWPRRLMAAGGGVKNGVWLQIISDIVNEPQEIPQVTIGASYGNAYLAGFGAGLFPDFDTLRHGWVKNQRVIEPRPKAHETYLEYYQVFRDCYKQLRPQLHRLASLGSGDATAGQREDG